jgi:hypothetical protein
MKQEPQNTEQNKFVEVQPKCTLNTKCIKGRWSLIKFIKIQARKGRVVA